MGQTSLGSGSRRSVAGLVCAVLLVAAGCGGGGGDAAGDEPSRTSATDAPPTTEAPATTSTTAELSDEEAVLAAIEGYWASMYEANDPPDPDHPALARFATGAALDHSRDQVEKNRVFGNVLRLPEPTVSETQLRSVDIDGDLAAAVTCEIDDGLKIHADSGEVLNDQVVSSLVEYRVERVGGTWKVERSDFVSTVEGSSGCVG